MSQSTCTHCGQPFDETAHAPGAPQYCRHCGNEVVQAQANDAPPSYGAPPYNTPPLTPPTPVNYPYAPGQYAPAPPAEPPRFWLTPARAFLISLLIGGLSLFLRPVPNIGPVDSTTSISYNIGAIIGTLLGPLLMAAFFGLIIAGIAALFKKPFSHSFPRFFALLIVTFATLNLLGSLVTAGTIKRQTKKQEARQFADDLEKDLGRFIEATQDADGTPRESDFRLETTPGRTEMERARNLIASYLNDMATLQNDYLASLDKAGLNRLLDADRLAKDTDYKESRAILEEVKTVATEYTKKAKATVTGMPKRIKSAPGSEREKQEFLKGYQQSIDRNMPIFDEIWALEIKSIDHFATLIDIFEDAHGTWTTENDMFVFQEEKHSDAFNKSLADLQAGLARQQELQQQTQSESMQKLNSLKQQLSR